MNKHGVFDYHLIIERELLSLLSLLAIFVINFWVELSWKAEKNKIVTFRLYSGIAYETIINLFVISIVISTMEILQSSKKWQTFATSTITLRLLRMAQNTIIPWKNQEVPLFFILHGI